MCQGCVDAIKHHFPRTPKKHYYDLLMCGTAFPAGGPDVIDRQLWEAKQAGCKNWKDVIAYADEQITKAMANRSVV